MEKALTVAILVALLAMPAAMLTAIGGGLVRLLGPAVKKPAWSIAAVGSAAPMLMLIYGIHAGQQEAASTKAGDTLSLGWWLLVGTPPSWIACLLVAWWIAPRRSAR